VAAGHSVAPASWQTRLDELLGRVAGRFARVEPRRHARALVLGLLADLPRKDCWAIAEHAGQATPDGLQHLLAGAFWDHDAVRDGRVTTNERIGAGRRERRVLTRDSRAAWRLEQAERERAWRWPRPAPRDLDPHLRHGDDWPGTGNVAAGLARVAAVLHRIASDAGELARAAGPGNARSRPRCPAVMLRACGAGRAGPGLPHVLPHQADTRLHAGADGTSLGCVAGRAAPTRVGGSGATPVCAGQSGRAGAERAPAGPAGRPRPARP
jgi:hypothetical protein